MCENPLNSVFQKSYWKGQVDLFNSIDSIASWFGGKLHVPLSSLYIFINVHLFLINNRKMTAFAPSRLLSSRINSHLTKDRKTLFVLSKTSFRYSRDISPQSLKNVDNFQKNLK